MFGVALYVLCCSKTVELCEGFHNDEIRKILDSRERQVPAKKTEVIL